MKKLIIGLCVALMTLGGGNFSPDTTYAAGGRSSGSMSSGRSFSGSSSGGSRPSVGSSSSGSRSAPAVRPNAPSAAPSSPSRVPAVRPNSPATPSNGSSSSANSSKPQNGTVDAAAASARNRSDSAKVYNPAPAPKPSYTTSSGRTVSIQPDAPSTIRVRSMTVDSYRTRNVRFETHYHTIYGSRYDYYRSQPYIDVGGGYSPLFWYAMMDWNMDRQAAFLYNNQSQINSDLYAQRLQNAELRAKIEQMKANGVKPDANYVDAEFKNDPDLMMDDKFVEAAYNPQESGHSWTCWLCSTIGIIGLIALIVWLVFFRNWNNETYN